MKSSSAAPADPYQNIVDLYDLEHDGFSDDVDLLVNVATVIGDPILELGCGSGRILRPIAEAGFHVVGLDSSRPMLDKAATLNQKAGLSDKITLLEGDMRHADAVAGGPFGLVILSLNSIMHLTTPEDQRCALSNIRRVLDPRGQLIVDTINPSPGQLTELLNGPHLDGSWRLDDGRLVDKWSHRRMGEEPQVIETLLWYDILGADGAVQRIRSAFPLRYVYPSELLLMLELAGFVDPMMYGSYDLDPFEQDSDRLIVTAEVTSAP